MIPSFICTADNQSFTSLEALEEHEKSGHTIKGTSTTTPMDPQFAETLRQIQEAEKTKKNQVPVPMRTDLPTPTIKPVQLTYKFTGNCDKCSKEPSTLMIETPDGLYATAFCVSDNIQLKSIKVLKLIESNFEIAQQGSVLSHKSAIMKPKIKHGNKSS